MRVIISGASGLIGKHLTAAFEAAGHETWRLVRREAGEREIEWDPTAPELDAASLAGFDVVVHLAGASVGEGRWSAARKHEIRRSRVHSTALLAAALRKMPRPPSAFICASAVGFYGDRGSEVLDESSCAGEGFLADVCSEWEGATVPMQQAGVRVCHARIGVVLAGDGGALSKMLPAFRMGVGGRIGDGQQWTSWISLDDVVRALLKLATDPSLYGAFNLVAPEPVTNAVMTQQLGRVLGRPTVLPLPAFAARWMLGPERAGALLLASTRVLPSRLAQAGFQFQHPTIDQALESALKKRAAEPVAA
jgi:uncharacterized protein (TIGR01777 family)